ncbi:MAG: UvrD-helicase domain-containing protein [Bacteroidetes bacterium]|nr:UvrD-helicase domain-containing protein [Bacteroidota bacterium]
MNVLDNLNISQKEAASVIDGPVMIIAGAGSGKTRVLTHRIAHMLEVGIKPYQILALTFTNKAAKEMKERILKLTGSDEKIWAGTFHSIFAKILRFESEQIGFTKSFTIYDVEESLNVIKSIMKSFNISYQQYSPKAIQSKISSAKNSLITVDELEKSAYLPIDINCCKIFREYQTKMLKNNCMDFDDLLLKPIELFTKNKITLEKYQYRFQYLNIDEFQDTNKAQYVLIHLLARKFNNICIVGDDAQSIYSFRGANINNIFDFEKDYAGTKLFRLEQNYRSTKTILNCANSLIEKNVNQIKKNLWTENENGDYITVLETDDDREEALQIVTKLQLEINSRNINLNDIAILYRTNSQSRTLEDSLRRQGYAYEIVGGIEFYKRKEIKDVLAYLKILINPADEESLSRIINYPARGIGETAEQKLLNFAKENKITLFEALSKIDKIDVAERNKKTISEFWKMIDKYQKLQNKISLSELGRSIVEETGILKLLKEEGTVEAMNRWENIQELLSAFTEFCDTREEPTLTNFLEEVSLMSSTDKNLTANKITLMTLHAAKGLEFPLVFITGLEEGLLPLSHTLQSSDEVEEERRLMYVGMTRAMKKLYLTYARFRYRFGEISYSVPSRFLDEIDKKFTMIESKKRLHAKKYSTNYKTEIDSTEKYFSQENYILNDLDNTSKIKRGTLVTHETFGNGKVMLVVGKGDNTKVTVSFDEMGTKNLLLKYANLKLR